ncbi:protein transport protein sec31 isoform X1 [Manduca sexta]|uniref:protein transport protein sec31 isoform X1 n=1 Tax=Manduca sexta TaxID=7130 RepID=UPI001890B58A|nr:protein transport protein sec31 isoform X1 [Manduca sexta]
MQRKPSYPVPNCSIKMPDCLPPDLMVGEDDNEQQQRRQHLINFGHSQWGFNNWSWSVTKQELDFVDFANGKYCAGVVAFVSIKLKNLDIHRENIGYATSTANTKGLAIYKSRKCAVTNALRETLLSFGGKVASDLLEILETARPDVPSVNGPGVSAPLVNASLVGAPLVSASLANSPLGNLPVNTPITLADQTENNQNIANRLEPKTSPVALCPRKEEVRPVAVPPMARAMPMPAALPPAPAPARVPPAHAPHPAAVPLRPNSNVSFVLSPVVGGLYAPRPPVFPEYYECAGPWHFACEPPCPPCHPYPPRGPVFRGPPEEPPACAPPPARGCWIKPTIFYDGFWTEQKVKKWVAEQVEKRFPGDSPKSSPSGGAQPDMHGPK